jgi:ABC-type polysaccharide/polyol phosphate export permease
VPLASGPVLRELLAREWRERYQGSVLGVAWLALLPLAQLAVLAFVFGTLLPARASSGALPYPMFLALGLFPWLLFANAVNRGVTAYLDNAGLIARVPLPPSLYVHARVLGSVIVDLGALALVIAVLVGFGLCFEAAGALAALVGVSVLALMALALARIAALLQVFVRDLAPLVGQLIGLGFFLAPVLYERTQLPAPMAAALGWNPLVAPLEAIRHGLSGEGALPWAAIGWSAVVAVLLLLASIGLQRRAGRHIEDFL